ncbi:DUF3592 domain-containing protein [Streptomyces microflavus]|uniref:DUF3592 domain-containing protein n=1 Tax=Streptomyces TaxID=1883 RepID=UPI00339E62C5
MLFYFVIVSGVAFLLFSAAVLLSDMRGLGRRERAVVTCEGYRPGSFGETVYGMKPIVRNGKVAKGAVRGKSLGIRVGQEVEVVYDPKYPSRMYLADRARRAPTLAAVGFFGTVGILEVAGALFFLR